MKMITIQKEKILPTGYKPEIGFFETETAIKLVSVNEE